MNPYSLNKGDDSSILGSNEIFGGEWNCKFTHQPKRRWNSHPMFQGLNIKCVRDTACYRCCEECHPLKCGLLQLLLQGYSAGINHAQRSDRPEIILIILLVFALVWAIASYLGSNQKDAAAMRPKHVPRDPLVETLVAMAEGRLERQQSETVHEPFFAITGHLSADLCRQCVFTTLGKLQRLNR